MTKHQKKKRVVDEDDSDEQSSQADGESSQADGESSQADEEPSQADEELSSVGRWRWIAAEVDEEIENAVALQMPTNKSQKSSIAWSTFKVIFYHGQRNKVLFEQ